MIMIHDLADIYGMCIIDRRVLQDNLQFQRLEIAGLELSPFCNTDLYVLIGNRADENW